MADKVRIAHVGVAFPHASSYIGVLLLMPEVEIVSFYDPNPEAARELLPPVLRGRPIYDDISEMLAKERPEAAQITLSNDITPDAVVQTAEAGVHLYVEKPCARTAAEFRPAAEAIRRAGVQFATAYTRRFSPVGQAIKNLVDRGLLGRLVSTEASWVTQSVQGRQDPGHILFSAERSGGGNLHWETCHALDFFRWVTSAEYTEVAANVATPQRRAHHRRGHGGPGPQVQQWHDREPAHYLCHRQGRRPDIFRAPRYGGLGALARRRPGA